MIYLLDANVLVALTVEEHEHHLRASRWAATVERVALCAVVEGALIRFLVRIGETPSAAKHVLDMLYSDPRCEFWGDSVSYVDIDLSHVRGHRQVTDAYLVGLVDSERSARLATLDRALANAKPDVAFLVPSR
ncbi:MAG TPA: PIN domain-containing protein [Jatrophihabitantaceae bacterium]|nr:PIN domain-containing protein [Jatrophihabitantaceae bacterium]